MRLATTVQPILLVAATFSTLVSAQQVPLIPLKVGVQANDKTSEGVLWRVGPIAIRLPAEWRDASKPHLAQLSGPESSIASFVVAEVTSEAARGGYNVLVDPSRGPDAFSRLPLDWTDCQAGIKPEVQKVRAKQGIAIRLAQCKVALGQSTEGTFAQIAVYSNNHLANIAIVGGSKAVQDFLLALESAHMGQ